MNAALAYQISLTQGPRQCRSCGAVLDGGPAVYWCPLPGCRRIHHASEFTQRGPS